MEITPVIWWEPVDPERPNSPRYSSWERVLAGKHDSYIRQWAEDARAAGEASPGGDKKILLRFAHEANGFWFAWGMGRFTNNPKNFKRAWRYVWRIFQDEGALAYVDFLWSVSKQRCPSCNPFAQVYPGDRYVDYAGVTAFNWGRVAWSQVAVDDDGPRRPDPRHPTRGPALDADRHRGDRLALSRRGQGGLAQDRLPEDLRHVPASEGHPLPQHR